ncbi:hypothetical protein KSF78_0004576 [Schistosoma japonicum]|nr:hypothetical protein KSF78_0004576 [Schistosoma japonicum]
MFYKKFLFLFMSSLLTCWGIDTPEYKSKLHEKAKQLNKTEPVAHGDLEKAYPKSWKAAKLFWEAAEEYFDQLNTTQHTNEKNLEQYLQASEKHDEHMIAHGDLEKAYPKSWKAAKLFWEAAEEYFDQLNTTQHTNEKNLEQYLQASEKHDEHMTDGDLEKTLQNALEKMGKYLNASKNLEQYLQASEKHDEHMTDGDLEKTLQNALEKMGKYLNASKEYFDQLNTTQHTNEKEYFDQLNTTQHTNEKNLKQFLEAEENFHEQLNKMKKFELKAIKANMKYKNNSGNKMNISLLFMHSTDKNDIF